MAVESDPWPLTLNFGLFRYGTKVLPKPKAVSIEYKTMLKKKKKSTNKEHLKMILKWFVLNTMQIANLLLGEGGGG